MRPGYDHLDLREYPLSCLWGFEKKIELEPILYKSRKYLYVWHIFIWYPILQEPYFNFSIA